uniref:NB-ARC domain-containing protein n=1 Tax=Fagus sylvatica TaxID=28930 RepID=A0A2N9J7Q3_FAGSY
MAEGLVSDLIKQLVSIAVREAEKEIRSVIGVDKNIKKLENNLRTVKAMLNDAEKRQVREEAVKLWLEKLKDACYEMDDVVDEWNTAMIKSEIQKEEEENADDVPVVKKKVCSFIPSPSYCFRQVDKLVLRHDIAHKIKEVNGKLDEVVRERVRYGFELTTRGDAPEVKDDLVSILLEKGSEEERCPHVISLVGMGGIGKTTLAQLAYNDPKVQAHFDIKMWVCVSDPFDQCRVAKAIIEALKDDVWTEDPKKWEPFSNAFKKLEGSQSSRILVTTRKIRVAKIMGSTSTRMINLEVLSEEDCWLVFSKIAFSDKDPEQCEQLENLGRQIAKKCKGLPLAAKTLGSLMRFKISSEQWKNVLDSNLWDLEGVENVIEKDLFASLFLSYYDLPSPLKRCFSYCAVYPKDYVFSSDELVEMWMAQGYIDSKENMEIIAREYLENLAIRSFFQDFENDKDDGQIRGCKMHDIVHDFAHLEYPRGFGRLTSLRRLSHFYVSGTKDGCKLGELKDLNQLQGSLDIRGLGNVVDVCEAENAQLKKKIHLHTLKLQFTGGYDRRIENDVSVLNALESPPNLKDLSIVGYQGTTMSPNWTMSLTKLKTLCLDYLEHLPPLGKLPVLESLKITRCNSLRKVGVEFLGIESENKKEDNMQIFPNLKSLEFCGLDQWEEWIGIGGKREEEEDSNITIMPRLQRLVILRCPSLNSLPDFLRTIPLKELEINRSSILHERCQRGTGEEWPKISHIPNIKIDGEDVQRDGQEVKSESDEEESDEEEYDEEEHAEEEFDKECKAEQNKALDIPCIIKLLDVGRDDVSHAEDEFDKEENNEKRV